MALCTPCRLIPDPSSSSTVRHGLMIPPKLGSGWVAVRTAIHHEEHRGHRASQRRRHGLDGLRFAVSQASAGLAVRVTPIRDSIPDLSRRRSAGDEIDFVARSMTGARPTTRADPPAHQRILERSRIESGIRRAKHELRSQSEPVARGCATKDTTHLSRDALPATPSGCSRRRKRHVSSDIRSTPERNL